MGNNLSFEPADDLETFSKLESCFYSLYNLKFKLNCTGVGSTCSFNGVSITFLSYGGQELENFIEFSSFSTVNNKNLTSVRTVIINDNKTYRITFDPITFPLSGSIDVVLRFKIKKLPCLEPIKIKLETIDTVLLSNIIRIYKLPFQKCICDCKC